MSQGQFIVGAPHFGRFTRTPDDNEAAIAQARDALLSAVEADPTQPGAADVLDASVDLAEALTIAGRESEAIALAEPAVRLARDSGRTESLGWALLVLATAEHYADDLTSADLHFREALELARTSGDRVLEHYTLHHLGRFLVDTDHRDEAIDHFTACLAIRDDLGEPRAAATRSALAALAAAG